MLRILHGTNYDFIKWWRQMVAITIAFIAIGATMVTSRVVGGSAPLNYSIEFSGGTLMQLRFAQPPHVDDLRLTVTQAGYGRAEIQQFGPPVEYTVRARLEGQTGAATAAQGDSVRRQIERAL